MAVQSVALYALVLGSCAEVPYRLRFRSGGIQPTPAEMWLPISHAIWLCSGAALKGRQLPDLYRQLAVFV